MASCKTAQWGIDSPYVKLTVTEQSSTNNTATLAWQLDYIADYPAETVYDKDYTILIDNTIVDTGKYDINGKTGTNKIASGTIVVGKTVAARNVTFEVSFAFNLYWNDDNIYGGTKTASGSINVAAKTTPGTTTTSYTACGMPTSLLVTDNGDNTVTLSCKVGANGTNNRAEGIYIFVTCNGTTPSSTNYNYRYKVLGTAGGTLIRTISFKNLPTSSMSALFGSSCKGTVKFTANTFGEAGANYSSATATVRSANFTWHGLPTQPSITAPARNGVTVGSLANFKITWTAGSSGINNDISKYTIRARDLTTNEIIAEYYTTNLYYDVAPSNFIAGHKYRFEIIAAGAISGFDSQPAISGVLTVKNIEKFQNLTITASDCSTVPSTTVSGVKTYIDIGSGNVLKVSWNTPTATENEIDYYFIYLTRYDNLTGTSTTLYTGNLGKVNEFYVKSAFLATQNSPSTCTLKIYVEGHSKYGQAYSVTSNILSPYVCKGCGTYIKVTDGYPQPVMKRAIAFNRLNYRALLDTNDKALLDSNEKQLYALISSTQDKDAGMTLMNKFYSKNADGMWCESDIDYEVLTAQNGEIITDSSNKPIYVL